MEVKLEGQEQLFNALKRFEKQAVYDDAKPAMKRVGRDIIAESIGNLRRNRSWATGFLANTGKVQEASDKQGLEVGFMTGDKNYASSVEYGIKNPKWFSYTALWNWVSKKHNLTLTMHTGKNGRPLKDDVNPEVKTIAYFVRNKIVRQGTKPHPFFEPAVRKHGPKVAQAISDAIKRRINRNGV